MGIKLLRVFILIGFAYIGNTQNASAQNCASNVPSYTLDFTGVPDTLWTSASVSRLGLCCNATGSDRCILFNITLDADAAGIVIDAVGGLGGTVYEIDCQNATSLGSITCITNSGSFNVTICKNGGNAQQYTVRSVPKAKVNKPQVYISPNCSTAVTVAGLQDSTISWRAITNSSYTGLLSCTTACANTVVGYSSNTPAYVDYEVCGTPLYATCLGNTFCDTFRVYFDTLLQTSISPSAAYLCQGNSTTPVSANATGGRPPYTYSWSNGSSGSSINVGTGTFVVTATDSVGCQVAKDTIVVTSQPNPAPSITGSTNACEDALYTYSVTSQNGHTYLWSITNGTIIGADDNNTVQVSWSSIGSGSLSIVQTNGSTGCFGSDTENVTIIAKPGQKTIQH